METPTQVTADQHRLSHPAVGSMAVFYQVTLILLIYLLCKVWPVVPNAVATVNFFGWSFELSPDARLIWLVVISSKLGSYIHTVTSFTTFAGNENLVASWLAWYLLRPAISAALALIFYFSLRAGLFSGASAE